MSGTIWLMAATLALAQWYRVPVHPFHAAVLTSFAVYLAWTTTLESLVAFYGYEAVRPYSAAAINRPAFLCFAG
jgi:hypothetical protein